jgi:hypothetical protein
MKQRQRPRIRDREYGCCADFRSKEKFEAKMQFHSCVVRKFAKAMLRHCVCSIFENLLDAVMKRRIWD